MAQRKRFSYVVANDGGVLRKMELYDGKNWITQMARKVADSVSEFRRKRPGTNLKHQPVQSAVEEQGSFSELLEVPVRDLPERVTEVNSIDTLLGLIENDDRETARRVYKQRAAELYRGRMSKDTDATADESEEGGSSEQGEA